MLRSESKTVKLVVKDLFRLTEGRSLLGFRSLCLGLSSFQYSGALLSINKSHAALYAPNCSTDMISIQKKKKRHPTYFCRKRPFVLSCQTELPCNSYWIAEKKTVGSDVEVWKQCWPRYS